MKSSHLETAPKDLKPEEWVDAYGDFLFRYAKSRLRDRGAAEEVVQETFLAGIRNLHGYSGTGTQRGWLVTILRRKIIDYVRNRARDHNPLENSGADLEEVIFDEQGSIRQGVLPEIDAENSLENKELWEIVRICLNYLPQGQADVFVLSVMEELESQEICKELNITPSNLWVRLHRARLSLARCVGSKWFLDSTAE